MAKIDIIISIIGVIGTWLAVYFAYLAIKKENKRAFLEIANINNSENIHLGDSNKQNIQIGKRNKNVQ